jgi:hypothetical protein
MLVRLCYERRGLKIYVYVSLRQMCMRRYAEGKPMVSVFQYNEDLIFFLVIRTLQHSNIKSYTR